MTEYTAAHTKLEHHQIAVIGALIIAFVMAFALMFIHPTAALVVFAIALIGLVAAGLVSGSLRRAERTAAQAELAHQACPKCGAKVEHASDRPDDWHCVDCDAIFSPVGQELL